jgi:hypothetical protein
MEQDSGAKIAIRGKGSVKEGKGRSDAAHASNQEEDLHCLIMADTEEKVNKAKALVHKVIETVSSPVFTPFRDQANISDRLLPFPRAKMNSSVTSSVSSLRSTALCEMTKIRHAKTAVRSVTGNMTAPSDRTSPPILFAVFAVMQVIWLATVRSGQEGLAGATTAPEAAQLVASKTAPVVMQLIVNTR